MSDTGKAHDNNLERMLFFSDAVFAIVLTLLVLELRPPELEHGGDAELAAGLQDMAVHFAAFFWTFALVGVWWVIHMRVMRKLQVFDWPVAVVNLTALCMVCLMPFAQALLGEHIGSALALGVYWCASFACAVGMMALSLMVFRGGGRLVGGIGKREAKGRALNSFPTVIAFGSGIAFAILGANTDWPGWIWLSRFCWVLIIPLQAIFGRALKSALAEKAATADPA